MSKRKGSKGNNFVNTKRVAKQFNTDAFLEDKE